MGWGKIEPLVARGRAAGQKLRSRFATASTRDFHGGMDWENHRVIRYRVAMSALQRFAKIFTDGYEGTNAQPGDATYGTLLDKAATPGVDFSAYAWPNVEKQNVKQRAPTVTITIATLSSWLVSQRVDFAENSPSPRPELLKR